MRVGFLSSSKFKTLFWYRWVTRGKKKPIQRLKKSPTSFSQSGLSFSNFGTLSLTTPETHIKSDPIFRNHRLYNTENQEKKKSHRWPINHPPRPTVSANPKWFSSPILVPLLHTIAGKFWIPLMIRRERERERESERDERDQWNLENRIGLGLNEFGFGS